MKIFQSLFDAAGSSRGLNERVPSQLVELIPFDISIALTDNVGIDSIALSDAISRWMNSNFDESVNRLENRYNFGQVILREFYADRRKLQSTYTVTYEGMTVWKRDKAVPDETIVAAIELETLLDREGLVLALQTEDDVTGLGSYVVDARGDLNRNAGTVNDDIVAAADSSNSVDVVIIVAVVIAGLAFLLLGGALVLAWRQTTATKRKYNKGNTSNTDTTLGSDRKLGATSSPHQNDTVSLPPSEISPEDGIVYSESVISDDISTSLSAYYKGSSSSILDPYYRHQNQKALLNDAASVSSMESYGYSLDGYTSSIAPADSKKPRHG